MPAAATTDVEKRLARQDTEAVEVDGQHEATGSRSLVRPVAASVIALRYTSTVACAVAVQLNRSSTRARAAVPMVARWAESQSRPPSAVVSAPACPAGTKIPARPSRPITSARAPTSLATNAVPEAIASTAGNEKPS